MSSSPDRINRPIGSFSENTRKMRLAFSLTRVTRQRTSCHVQLSSTFSITDVRSCVVPQLSST